MSTTLENHDVDIDVDWIEEFMLMLHNAPEVACQAQHVYVYDGISGGRTDPCSVEVKWVATNPVHPQEKYRRGALVCDNFRLIVLVNSDRPENWRFLPV